MVAGCSMQTDPKKFRTSQLCPYPMNTHPNDCEINGLWIAPEATERERLGFYLKLIEEIISNDYRRCYFSFDLKKHRLVSFYESFTEALVYEGYVRQIEGMTSDSVERICFLSPAHLRRCIPKLLVKRFARILRR